MLSSIGRVVYALLRFAIGAGLALIGAGLLRHDPRVPAAVVHLATQPPFGGLWWALVSLAGGVAFMLHALPSPWRTDRLADRGGPADAAPEPEPAPPVRRSFDAPVAPPIRWQGQEPDLSPAPSQDIRPEGISRTGESRTGESQAGASETVAIEAGAIEAGAIETLAIETGAIEAVVSEGVAVAPPVLTPTTPAEPAHVPPVAEASLVPVFRSRPSPRRPSRARMIGHLPS